MDSFGEVLTSLDENTKTEISRRNLFRGIFLPKKIIETLVVSQRYTDVNNLKTDLVFLRNLKQKQKFETFFKKERVMREWRDVFISEDLDISEYSFNYEQWIRQLFVEFFRYGEKFIEQNPDHEVIDGIKAKLNIFREVFGKNVCSLYQLYREAITGLFFKPTLPLGIYLQEECQKNSEVFKQVESDLQRKKRNRFIGVGGVIAIITALIYRKKIASVLGKYLPFFKEK